METNTPTKSARTKKADVDTSAIHNPNLYRAIIDWRRAVAKERSMPPAYIMPLRTIIAITNACPATPDELGSIFGIGPKTIAEHGADLLEIVATHRR